MALAEMLTPITIAIQLLIFIAGCYAGYKLKIQAGYLFALTFLLFAAFDIVSMMGYGDDMLSLINIIASLSALGGMYLLMKQI
ncbi:MAG: hypothetical protein Q7J09_11900 [Methanocalculus sp.]|uniref:hypothetical protein n=1 Tax=Methanocalculus sp. TaxID=2004547 RepID=UPI002723A2E3|nr:hypothetical protein [Methanocalculus sp.]MDO9540688.1 hypothetical protein [Methanocalculus sp.]